MFWKNRRRRKRLDLDQPAGRRARRSREPGRAGDRAKRPATQSDPDSNDQATMWPDSWAAHRS